MRYILVKSFTGAKVSLAAPERVRAMVWLNGHTMEYQSCPLSDVFRHGRTRLRTRTERRRPGSVQLLYSSNGFNWGVEGQRDSREVRVSLDEDTAEIEAAMEAVRVAHTRLNQLLDAVFTQAQSITIDNATVLLAAAGVIAETK